MYKDGSENRKIHLLVLSTSWLSSMAHSLADWALASTMTLNMVHMDWGTRKSVVRGLFCNFTSKAALVLKRRKRKTEF